MLPVCLFMLLIYVFPVEHFLPYSKLLLLDHFSRNLVSKILKNFRPVSNLTFLSKLIEKVIANRLVAHMQDNGIMENFQFAYKARHSTETALLRLYNDL